MPQREAAHETTIEADKIEADQRRASRTFAA